MKTQFLGQAYQSRSPMLASQTAINIYPEIVEAPDGNAIGGFYGTPGLQSIFQGTGEVRGLRTSTDGKLYAVVANQVYRLNNTYTPTSLGNLPNASGPVSIIDNGSQIAVAHEDGWHWVSYTGSAIASVVDSPDNCILTEQDNYVIYTDDTSGTFGITALGDLSVIDPLDFASEEGAPDPVVSVVSLNREPWLLGSQSTGIWNNTGAALFPFERAPSGFFEVGCAARRSPAKIDNSLFWLAQDEHGQGLVVRNNAYGAQRISTHAIEFSLREMSDISDAIGFTYQDEGHSFYWLTFPTGQKTWVYDVATKGWHQRAYQNSQGLLQRHRANCYANFNGKHLVGDYANGKIYEMSLDFHDDDGDTIYRERAWELPDNENKRIRGDYLELVGLAGDGESGSAPLIALEVSQDAGRTWGYERIVGFGKQGQHTARARWRRLGTGRNTVYRVSTEMRNRISWTDAIFRGEALSQ